MTIQKYDWVSTRYKA